MFSAYFEKLEEKLLKSYSKTAAKKTAKKATKATKTTKKTAKKKTASDNFDYKNEFAESIENIIPANLSASMNKAVDSSGYTTDSADVLLCEKIYRDFDDIFSEAIPSDFIKGALHICGEFNRKNLVETLVKVANTKKLNHYAENYETEDDAANIRVIPCFSIAFASSYTLKELKESIIEIYNEENVDSLFEFDIMIVLGLGIIVKNWRERRSFIALETGKDTLKWFFVLMNEYIGDSSVDLRSLVRETKVYTEY